MEKLPKTRNSIIVLNTLTKNWPLENFLIRICTIYILQFIEFLFLVIFRYDFVSVRDGGTTQSPLVGRYCGHSLPPSHLSTGNQLVIRFKSDHSVSHEGFRASYRAGKI